MKGFIIVTVMIHYHFPVGVGNFLFLWSLPAVSVRCLPFFLLAVSVECLPFFLTWDFPANGSWLHWVMFEFPVHIVYRAMSWSFLFVSALAIGNIVSSNFRFIDFSLFFCAFFPPCLKNLLIVFSIQGTSLQMLR